MYCKNCGSVMTENGCSVCGQNQNEDRAPAATPSTTPYTPYASAPVTGDKKSIGFNILSFFIPLAGLIIFLVKKDEKPIQAKSAGKSAIAGLITNVVLSIVVFCFSVFGLLRGIAGLSGIDAYDTEDGYVAASSEAPDYGTFDDAADYSASVGALDWNNVKVSIDGTTVTLPCAYSDFTGATGYTLDADDKPDEPLGEREYTYASCSSSGKTVSVTFYNPGNTAKTAEECQVVGVSVDTIWSDDTPATIVFPGDIHLGSETNMASLSAAFGAADYTYVSDDGSGYWSATWESPTDSYSELEVTSYDGITLGEISIRNFGD